MTVTPKTVYAGQCQRLGPRRPRERGHGHPRPGHPRRAGHHRDDPVTGREDAVGAGRRLRDRAAGQCGDERAGAAGAGRDRPDSCRGGDPQHLSDPGLIVITGPRTGALSDLTVSYSTLWRNRGPGGSAFPATTAPRRPTSPPCRPGSRCRRPGHRTRRTAPWFRHRGVLRRLRERRHEAGRLTDRYADVQLSEPGCAWRALCAYLRVSQLPAPTSLPQTCHRQ